MATTKKPNTNPNPGPKTNPRPSFDFQEYEKVKSLYKINKILNQAVQEAREKYYLSTKEIEKLEFPELRELINQIMSIFDIIRNNKNDESSDVKAVYSVYRELAKILIQQLINYSEDFNNRNNILRAKLEDLEEKKRAYIDYELRGIHECNTKDDKDWKHINEIHDRNQLFEIFRQAFGMPPPGRAIIIDSDGVRFY